MEGAVLRAKLLAMTSVWLIVSLSWGCDQSAPSNQMSHDRHDPVRSEGSFNWVELTRSQFISQVLKQGGRDIKPVQVQFNALAQRAEFWINRIDSALRRKYPEELLAVPRPTPIVIAEKSPNAFIAAAFSCFEVPTDFSRSGEQADKVYLSLQDGGEFSSWPEHFTCVPGKRQQLEMALAAFNARSEACQIEFDGISLDPSDACALHSEIDSIGSAQQIVIPQTADWVTIHSSLFAAMPTEKAFVGVIAHELAHYYRSHITSYSDEYGFFYDMGMTNPDHKPQPDLSLTTFGKAARSASQVLANELQTVVGQKIRPEVYLLAGSVAEYNCQDGSCPDACALIAGWEDSSEFSGQLGIYPFDVPSSLESYKVFEETAVSCLSETSVGMSGDVSLIQLQEMMATPLWLPFDRLLSPNGKKIVAQILENLAAKMPQQLPGVIHAYSWVEALSKHYQGLQDFANSTLDEARAYRLGYYTAEQEADEQSIEWLSLIGLNPRVGIETYLALAGMSADRLGGHIFGGQTCRQLYANNWLNNFGDPIFVPIGDYDEVHHSSCFRAYNVQREIDAHGYIESNNSVEPDGLTWDQLQKMSTRASVIRSYPVSHQPHSLMQKVGKSIEKCPFGHQYDHQKI